MIRRRGGQDTARKWLIRSDFIYPLINFWAAMRRQARPGQTRAGWVCEL